MKSVLLTLIAFASLQAFAQPKPDEHEINRRDFLSLNSDLSEVKLIVHYPGGSEVTNVCGLSLRTNIPVFANSHTEAFTKEIQIVDESGKELTAKISVAEPPVYTLEREDVMGVMYKLRTKSGKSLRTVIRETAEAQNLKFDREPDIIVVARHCKDQS